MLGRLFHCINVFFRLQAVVIQQIYGAWRVSSLPKPIITIFGGARFNQTNIYAKQAHELARMFADEGVSVLTGGGSGIMEAASCGVIASGKGKGRTMGISVSAINELPNPCVQEYIELDYFYARKWLLTRYASGFIFFPGGFGTLDELGEILTLIQTGKSKRVPIILIGREYWDPLSKWLTDEALSQGLISKESFDLLHVTDDLNDAFCIVRDRCKLPDIKPL
jgi:uncharacterized protein (TIGR00730 family)